MANFFDRLYEGYYPQEAAATRANKMAFEEAERAKAVEADANLAARMMLSPIGDTLQRGASMEIPARPGAYRPNMTMGANGPMFSPTQEPGVPARPAMDDDMVRNLTIRAMGGPAKYFAAQQAQQAAANQPFNLRPGERRYQGERIVAEAPFKPDEPPEYGEIRTYQRGGQEVTEELTPDGWAVKSTAPRFQPREEKKPDYGRFDYWRNQFKPVIDAAQNTMTQTDKVKKSLGLNSGVGDIAAVNALQKQIDEGAVVRDQDVALIQSAQSFLEKYGSEISRLKEGKLLSPGIRTQMQTLSDQLTDAIIAGAEDRMGAYKDIMGAEGVGFESVVPVDIQRKLKSRGAKSAPQAPEKPANAPPDARMGKDPQGNPGWFSPDPMNPGKYIQW